MVLILFYYLINFEHIDYAKFIKNFYMGIFTQLSHGIINNIIIFIWNKFTKFCLTY